MGKGFTPLEIVMAMLFVIIVFSVAVVLYQNFLAPKTYGIASFDTAYNAGQERATCNKLCSNYVTSNCSKAEAVKYCLRKVSVDISGNRLPGETGKGGFVNFVPYCEDGLYCFHVNDCNCRNYNLDAANCLKVLCDYYVNTKNMDSKSALRLITSDRGITWGSCDLEPTEWSSSSNIPVTNLRSDYWFQQAGYYSLKCTNVQPGMSGIKFANCVYDKNAIVTCDTSCQIDSMAFMVLDGNYIDAETYLDAGKVAISPLTGTLSERCAGKANSTFSVVFFCSEPSGYSTAEFSC